MKTIKLLILAGFLTVAAAGTSTLQAQVSVSADVTFSVFHDNLAPYGRWETHPRYGQIWIANQPGFIPYRTGGHWVYTDDGWTWVSDYDWGWAPFHYGRWDYDEAYGGYYWVPDYEWGPAWVSWRSDNEAYGWAPLRPGINIGVGISFGSDIPADRWTFVPNRYIASPQINNYYIDRSRNVTIINRTTIINNVHNNNTHVAVIGGPRRTDVQRYTHTNINTYRVANNSRPGTVVNRNTVNIYRPVVNKTTVVNKTVINNHNTTINNKVVNKQGQPNRPVQPSQPGRPVVNNHPAPQNRPVVNNNHPAPANKPAPNRPTVTNRPAPQPNRPVVQHNAPPKTPATRPVPQRQQLPSNVAKPAPRPTPQKPANRPMPSQQPRQQVQRPQTVQHQAAPRPAPAPRQQPQQHPQPQQRPEHH